MKRFRKTFLIISTSKHLEISRISEAIRKERDVEI